MHVRDENHDLARALEAEITDGLHGRALTTTFVVDELMTLIQARGAGKAAVAMAADLLGLEGEEVPLATVLDVDQTLVHATWGTFQRHYEDGLSFTDCSHLVVMDRWNIDRLATFDGGFEGLVDVVPATG